MKQHKGRQPFHFPLRAQLHVFLRIDFHELHLIFKLRLTREFTAHFRGEFARPAPRGVEIHEDWYFRLVDEFLETGECFLRRRAFNLAARFPITPPKTTPPLTTRPRLQKESRRRRERLRRTARRHRCVIL